MNATVTKDNLFRPAPSRAETKSEITTRTAKAMIDADVNSREAKTARLRKARLAMEASQPEPEPAKPRRKAAAKPKQKPSSA
jgi:hypothetical protein